MWDRENLTFEHVPPKALFNNKSKRMFSGIDALIGKDKYPWEYNDLKYEQCQQGSGGYYLCAKCNSFIGKKYNKEFLKLTKAIGYHILEICDEEFTALAIETPALDTVAILKQIMAMFCDISPMCFNDENLRNYVLDENSNKFDFNKYKVYMYAISPKSTMSRIIDFMGLLNIYEDSKPTIITEIASFPIGFTLYVNVNDKELMPEETKIKECDITCFANGVYGEKRIINLSINIHEINSTIGNDFRSKDEIIACVRDTEEKMKNHHM